MPKLNEVDLDELPDKVRDELEFIMVDDVREVLDTVLLPSIKPVEPETEESSEDSVLEPEKLTEVDD